VTKSSFAVDRNAPALASAEAVLAATPEAVWALLSDIDGWPAWNADVKQARLNGPLAPGSRFTWKAGPGTIHSVLQVVEAPHRIGWTGRTMGIAAAHVWDIAAGKAGTRVLTEESWDGFIVKLLRGMMRKQLQKSMDAGLRHLEAELGRRARQ
jgi:uncharacterized protein YndB with AHSA1/START domain